MNSQIEQLKNAGFTGFVTVADLRQSCSCIPDVMGVYVVLRTSHDAPSFVNPGTGGFFKGKDPNVPVSKLRENWVDGNQIMYIGKAGDPGSSSTLRKRIKQYIGFGEGKPVGHQGGCYIWQLSDAADLVFAWKPLPGGYPSTEESRMIQEFKTRNGGMRPFANRIG
ncbi:MAG: hypothetical protein K2K84_09900 [Muribaculaceae bacterium]|nr:hypothetical protein [Muribaculaceae bacterium]